MVKTISIEYLAGLFDGEGTVTLTKRRSTDKFRSPSLSLTSTTRELVDVMKQHFGGWVVSKKTYSDHHKQAWHWYCAGDAAIDASEKLLPHILEPEKARRMSLLSTEYKAVTVRNGKYTPSQLAAKTTFEHRFLHPSGSISCLTDLGTL